MLTEDQVRRFHRNGFAAAGPIGDPAELGWIAELCDRAFARRYGVTPASLDRPAPGAEPNALMTIVSPEGHEPDLSKASMVGEAREMAAHLFDVQTAKVWLGWRLFVKPAGAETTPWHQDAAYRPPPHHGATFWIPIDVPDADRISLRFIPGTHRGPLMDHDWVDGHLAISGIADDQARDNPVGVGEASVHHCLTLHSADPNRTMATRRAIALVCQIET